MKTAQTQLDLFENDSARKLFLEEMSRRVTRDIGLPRKSTPGKNVKAVVITLPRSSRDRRKTIDKVVKL